MSNKLVVQRRRSGYRQFHLFERSVSGLRARVFRQAPPALSAPHAGRRCWCVSRQKGERKEKKCAGKFSRAFIAVAVNCGTAPHICLLPALLAALNPALLPSPAAPLRNISFYFFSPYAGRCCSCCCCFFRFVSHRGKHNE